MKQMKTVIVVLFVLLSVRAQAWMTGWEPAFACEPAKVRELPSGSSTNLVHSDLGDDLYLARYSHCGVLDLNHDGVDDYVIVIPWRGCGLNASGFTAHMLVSDGMGGRMETVVEGYDIELSDLVTVGGKTYFRHSTIMPAFEKSKHNHWVYQVFAFGTNGVMRCANAEVGAPFPAATIYYKNPKFKPVELTAADLRKIAEETKPDSHRYDPKAED